MILQILNAVLKIIGIVTGIDSLVKVIEGDVTQSAQETTKFLIQTNTNIAVNDLADPTFGLAKLASNQALIIAAIATARSDILTAIANLTNGTTPVSLPPTPPPPYVPPTSSQNASDVWNFQVFTGPPGTTTAAGAVVRAYLMARNWGRAIREPFQDAPFFQIAGGGDAEDLTPFIGSSPRPLIRNVRPGDTVLSWLQREASFFNWQVGIGGEVFALDNRLAVGVSWICTLTDASMHLAANGTISATQTAPVWPGLANVTLGTPLALVDGLTVPGPLHGVIVHVTAVSYPVSFYPFGSLKSFVKIGGIVFVDDNGQGEMAQPLGLEQDVICPQTMVQADHALIRLKTGTTGTVTPWL